MSGSNASFSRRHRKAISGSTSIYRRLLFFYPEDFRREYAGEMARYFGELCEDALRRGGFPALVAMWVRTLSELALSARVERAKVLPQTERTPSDAVLLATCFWPGAGQAYNGQPIKGVVHALVFLTSIVVAYFLEMVGNGLWYIWLVVVVVFIYSAMDAWIKARKINAALRDGPTNS